jgi:hypothetical protein
MSTETKDRDLQEIGRTAFEGIAEMVAALECDYSRLEELREERADLETEANDDDADTETRGAARVALSDWDAENGEELAELTAAATLDGDLLESREDAETRIQEDALSVEVRSGWVSPGHPDFEPEEFVILLCTGGPAVRIRGEISGGQPSRAWLEVQDWFKPWTEYTGSYGEAPVRDILLAYASQFYFGE